MDIQKAIADLLGSGFTQAQLAERIPCSQSLVSALLNGTRGSRPSHAIASKVEALHAEHLRNTGRRPTPPKEVA